MIPTLPLVDTIFFLSLLSPHPTSTLFPYTTLFRSADQAPGPVEQELDEFPELPRLILPFNRSSDRKSTRLNSSHQIISYAVFCLKKKMAFCAKPKALSKPPPVIHDVNHLVVSANRH